MAPSNVKAVGDAEDDLAALIATLNDHVRELQDGEDDKFSPAGHANWLAAQIRDAKLEMRPGVAHFDAVKILPGILSWVLAKENETMEAPITGPGSGSGLTGLRESVSPGQPDPSS